MKGQKLTFFEKMTISSMFKGFRMQFFAHIYRNLVLNLYIKRFLDEKI
jgi:hypothetical protein